MAVSNFPRTISIYVLFLATKPAQNLTKSLAWPGTTENNWPCLTPVIIEKPLSLKCACGLLRNWSPGSLSSLYYEWGSFKCLSWGSLACHSTISFIERERHHTGWLQQTMQTYCINGLQLSESQYPFLWIVKVSPSPAGSLPYVT